jgi:hypothetical protein
MSFEVTTSFVQQYRNTLAMLAQQKMSRLRSRVYYEPVTGQTAWFDQLGASNGQKITSRHADTPIANTPHRRRRIDLAPYNWADLIENADKARMLTDPTSKYAQTGNSAMNRLIDDAIIPAFFATAYTGGDGTTQVTFPASNQIAVNSWAYGSGSGNAGLTISKLIEARVGLLGGEVTDDYDDQEMDNVYIAVTARQLGNLLATTEVTSKDYNAVQALVEGQVKRFMGFEFVRTERLQLDANGYTRVPVWHKDGMYLGIAEDMTQVAIGIREDKNRAVQPYYEMVFGAARIEEARVWEIKCT